ncbi:hypothetical protein BV898_15717 [Hypsibius exemplaris]|uniref:DUF1279 domain-containing protein n=1 Tax=Hypsibius exemplaris TaxID=2072580 RepID=A0A9X6NDK1_HYPEX|nr:hypothetical protein BV898_15717 [Hypsibius exemplaris]
MASRISRISPGFLRVFRTSSTQTLRLRTSSAKSHLPLSDNLFCSRNCISRGTSTAPEISTPESSSSFPNSASSSTSFSILPYVKDLYNRYGPTALAFHTAFSAVSLLFWWALVHSPNVDVTLYLAQIGVFSPLTLILTKTVESFGAGTFTVAYVLHKATGPLRLLLTLIVTPLIVRRAGARNTVKMVQEAAKP